MPPMETALILRAMVVASELGTSWGGYQDQQNRFAKLLEEYGLKRPGDQLDARSGGPRTYESQMSLLGLIYKDDDGRLKLTQAGEDIVAFNDTAATFEYQILKAQYPSAYSMASNVGIDTNITVRPFVFILNLANDPDLNGISDKEISIPVVFGKNSGCHDLCKRLILKMRSDGLESVIPDDMTIRTARTRNNSYEKRIQDIKDIANTFKNVLESSGIADLKVADGEIRLYPRRDVVAKLKAIESLPFVDFITLSEQQATLQYGRRLGAIKDTRRVFMPSTAPELHSRSGFIYKTFLSEVCLPVSQIDVDDFVSRMTNQFRISRHQVLQALDPILQNPEQYSGARLVELSRGGQGAAEAFEKTVAKIFSIDFGYDVEWTGRTHRDGVGGHMDVFVVDVDNHHCGIIDAKSTNTYELPHSDSSKAIATYIDAARELYGNRILDLKFVAYISHTIGSGAEIRAKEIYDRKRIPVSLVSAYGLNSMRSNNIYRNRAEAVTGRLSKNPVNLIV